MDQPNIILIMTDQQRGDCLGIEGHPALQTPNMDYLATSGARFARAYSTCPSCIAARRSLMTGQHPQTHGMVGYHDFLEWDAPPTLPGMLSQAGYQTQIVGRSMHLHPRRKRYGFDHMTLLDHRNPSEYTDFLKRNQVESAGGLYGTGVMHNDWTAHPWHMDEALHPTNWTVHEALRFLERRDPSCPFFLVVSFIAPHPPLVPPAFYLDRYLRMDLPDPVIGDWAMPPKEGGKGVEVAAANVELKGEALRCARAGYYGLINHVDDQVRRFLNPVTGIQRMFGDNTIVLLTSDHGEMLGDHYLWRKSLAYEPAARIPLLIRAPKRYGLGAGKVIKHPVCLEDVMPTLLDFAGIDVPETVEGRSLLPLLRDEGCPWREHLHIEHSPRQHGLTDGHKKFIWDSQNGGEQFFDLANDPTECRNLAELSQFDGEVSQWRQRLIEKLAQRPEGFTDGDRLIPGRKYPAVIGA